MGASEKQALLREEAAPNERCRLREALVRIPEAHRPDGPVRRHRIDTFEIEDMFGMDDREELIFGAAK